MVDEHFIYHLKTGKIKVEVYAVVGSEPLKIGEGYIPLSALLIKNQEERCRYKSYIH